MLGNVFVRLIPILSVSIGNPLRWPPELLSYHICTFSIIANAIAKVGETDYAVPSIPKKILIWLGKQESSDLFMLMMIVVIVADHIDHSDHIHYTGCHCWLICIMVIAIINAERQLQLSCCWKIQFSRALIFSAWESEI